MAKTRVGDIEMYYELHGQEGTPLVHIGGLAGDARAWQRQIEFYAQNHRVLAFDNRGTGRTDCPEGPYSTKLFAQDTVGLMDSVGFEAAHVLGISMGGAIAQEIALNNPDRVLSLIINCSFAKMDRYGACTIENIMDVYEKQGPKEAARHFVLYFYTLPYFNEHREEVDTKEQALGDSQRPVHAEMPRRSTPSSRRDQKPSLRSIADSAVRVFSSSLSINPVILRTALMTVVWSLPPKRSPSSG